MANEIKLKKAVIKQKKEADKALNDVLFQYNNTGDYVENQKVTFQDVYKEFMATEAAATRAYATLKRYDSLYRNHYKSVFDGFYAYQITSNMINDFISDKLKTYSEEYAKGLYKTLKVIMTFAHNRKYLKKNPFEDVTPPPDPRHVGDIRYYEPEEISLMGERLKETNVKLSFYIALNTGLRESEVFGLQWSDVDFENMRIHPVALYLYTRDDLSIEEKIEVIHFASAITHARERSKIGCGIYSFVLWEILDKKDKFRAIRGGLSKARRFYRGKREELISYDMLFRRIGQLDRNFEDVDTLRPAGIDEIKSGGYVVNTLEAAIFSLLRSQSYEDCVLRAINLGDDTDTVGAVAGGLAGALYGYDSIPEKWLDTLKKKDYIENMCKRAAESWDVTN